MQLRLSNGYSHAVNEVKLLTQQRRHETNPGGQRSSVTITWDLEGYLFAADQASLTDAINRMTAAYGANGFFAAFLDNSGNFSSYQLGDALSRGGCNVVAGPTLVHQYGSEYTNYHTYRITLEADYDSPFVDIWDFHETISYVGDGSPQTVWVPNLNMLPQRQVTYAATTYKAVQSGVIVGMFRYIAPPGPLFPSRVLGNLTTKVLDAPRRYGPVGRPYFREFSTHYSYTFESDVPFNANPTRWI